MREGGMQSVAWSGLTALKKRGGWGGLVHIYQNQSLTKQTDAKDRVIGLHNDMGY